MSQIYNMRLIIIHCGPVLSGSYFNPIGPQGAVQELYLKANLDDPIPTLRSVDHATGRTNEQPYFDTGGGIHLGSGESTDVTIEVSAKVHSYEWRLELDEVGGGGTSAKQIVTSAKPWRVAGYFPNLKDYKSLYYQHYINLTGPTPGVVYSHEDVDTFCRNPSIQC